MSSFGIKYKNRVNVLQEQDGGIMRKVKLVAVIVIFITVVALMSCVSAVNDSILQGFELSSSQMRNRNHIEQVKAFGAGSTAYINKDGSKTIYLNAGLIEYSQNVITEKMQGYYTSDGTHVKKNFSKEEVQIKSQENPGNYINIFWEEEKEPLLVKHVNSFGQKMDSVCYKNMFGENSDVYFYSTVYGVNSEIVIPNREAVGKYTFNISVPDIFPQMSLDYILLKNLYEEDVNLSMLYMPMVVDSNGKWSNSNKIELINKDMKDGTYIVQFSLDEEFVNSEDTEYPIVMNQSFYLDHYSEPDNSVFSQTTDEDKHYLTPYMMLGDDTAKGEGYALIRFESLEEMKIDPESIVSAKYYVRNLYDLPKKSVVGLYAVTSDWCSINTTWRSMPSYDEKRVAHVLIEEKGDYCFDITDLVKQMFASTGNEVAKYSVRNGFFIKSETSGVNMLFASGDNGLFTPCLELIIR